ncbi:MAG: cell division protein FtsQ/DivIB [Holosporales bacterium]|jgi:cell division protein FtsQ|nr:cell division protein FtsQ/DivIB [Holosporales bacterium]
MAKKKNKSKKKQSKSVKYIILAMMIIVIGGGFYMASGYIKQWASNLIDMMLGSAGFIVKTIDVSYIDDDGNRCPINPRDELNLGIEKGESIFKLSAHDIHTSIMKDSSIHKAIVKKKLPNSIIIYITKKIPMAIFQHDAKFSLIDENGTNIEDVSVKTSKFPIIVGEDANLHAKSIMDTIKQYDIVNKGLETLIFIRKRRWNMVVFGMNIKLPETNIDKTFDVLSGLLQQENINKKTVKSIDLRVPGNVIIDGLRMKGRINQMKTI